MGSRNASFHEGGISGALLAPLGRLCAGFLVVMGLLLAAWVIDWIFVFHVWPDGLARLERILREDLARAEGLGGWMSARPDLPANAANLVYATLFKLTGIYDMGMRFAQEAPLSIPDTIVRNTYIANFEAIRVAMVGTQLFGVRLATLTMATPLFGLVYGVALTDGLAQRAVRRASGGRESASLYHRAKHLQIVLLVTTGAVSLLLPVSIDPRYIWVPGALVVAILVRIQWAYYKKHL